MSISQIPTEVSSISLLHMTDVSAHVLANPRYYCEQSAWHGPVQIALMRLEHSRAIEPVRQLARNHASRSSKIPPSYHLGDSSKLSRDTIVLSPSFPFLFPSLLHSSSLKTLPIRGWSPVYSQISHAQKKRNLATIHRTTHQQPHEGWHTTPPTNPAPQRRHGQGAQGAWSTDH
jgi:hypothetical protein